VFSSKQPQNQPKGKRPVVVRDTAVTILTSGCHFNGKLYCRGSSRIGGRIEGQIISEGLLIIEEQAIITAEIKADEVVIQGKVKGKLEASGRVELTNSSWFEGDIATPVLVVNEGAQFNGRSKMISAKSVEVGKISQNVAKMVKKEPRADSIPFGEDVNDKIPDVAVMKSPEVSAT
jgi:cytoskeletal protein CcmA (bactofilin family)